MSRKSNQRKWYKRISIRRTLRSEKPTESSATRDSMCARRRNWGCGLNIDHRGNQDHDLPDDESIHKQIVDIGSLIEEGE